MLEKWGWSPDDWEPPTAAHIDQLHEQFKRELNAKLQAKLGNLVMGAEGYEERAGKLRAKLAEKLADLHEDHIYIKGMLPLPEDMYDSDNNSEE